MKRIYLSILMCFLCPIIFGQQTNIEGLGAFKINTTQLWFIEYYAKEKSIQIKKLSKAEELDNYTEYNEIYIIEIIPDTIKPKSAIASANFCPKTRVFMLSKYEVAGIKIKGLTLTFYNDLLIDLYCDNNPELKDALQMKYGEPITEVTTSKSNCYTEDISTHQSWHNGNITAVSYTTKTHDPDCKPLAFSIFMIFDASKSSRLENCNKKYKNVFVQRSLQDL
ncbi:MAG: hypothetical protein ISR55_10580 [Bacteroidetes bacterium]|nr:hypothetical protein [Bacteroidota bacterium]MBL6964260.1 hypothetical protein [Bacteroidota bacterium]